MQRGIIRSKTQVSFLWIFLSALLYPTTTASLPNYPLSVNSLKIRDSIEASLPANAQWSFSAIVVDGNGRRVDFGNAKGRPLVPASVMKLLTTAAILDLDTKDRLSLDTVLSVYGAIEQDGLNGDLYLKGTGNAFLSEKDLHAAAEAMRSMGINVIKGDIVADDRAFAVNNSSGYKGAAYAMPGALGLDLHTVSLTVTGKLPEIKTEPANESVRVALKSNGKTGIRQIDDLHYEISGRVSEETTLRKRFPLKDPALYAAGVLKTLLKKKGISINGAARRGETPAGAEEIFRIPSRSISEIAKDTNKNSINVSAENLLYFLGDMKYGFPGTIDKGTMAVKAFLEKIGVDHTGMTMLDGSGLSASNQVAAEMMADFLARSVREPWFESFYDSLPRAGMDGTLRDLSYKNEHARAKTGRLRNAYCLAGYVDRGDKNRIAFAYMLNVPGADLSGDKATSMLLDRLSAGGL